jgi:hypothetical protein
LPCSLGDLTGSGVRAKDLPSVLEVQGGRALDAEVVERSDLAVCGWRLVNVEE